jgi:butyryl-CoA dehydrogenase
VPEEYDGPGLDAVSIGLIYEELGKGCAGVATTVAANSLASYPVILLGDDAQKKMFFNVINSGRLGAFALTEPGAGSDAGAVATTAVKDGDDYILNGTKCFITNGGTADIFIIFANARKSAGIRGLTAFIVERGTPGFSSGKEEHKMGIRASNTCELILDNVRIPASNRLGREGEGFKIAMKTLDAARPFVGAVSVGLSQAAFEAAVKYSKEREQFGKPIASFQLVQAMIADMAMQIAAARLLVYKACWLKDQNVPFTQEAAIAKCFAADTAMKVTIDAVQVLGGYGYIKEYPTEKYMRDAKIMQIYEGTNQIQRLVIANQILY